MPKGEYACLPLIDEERITELKNNLRPVAASDYSNIILFSDATLYFYDVMPEMSCYLFRDYKEIDESDTGVNNGRINLYKDEKGIYRGDNGQIFAGKFKDYERILNTCQDPENTYIVFWNCNEERAEADLTGYLAEQNLYNEGVPVSVEEHRKKLE